MQTLKIQKGWYRSAGHKYGWTLAGFEPEGVGINRQALDAEKLIVVVNDVEYEVDCQEAIDFVKKYKSHYTTDGGTKIGVISRSIMKKLNESF